MFKIPLQNGKIINMNIVIAPDQRLRVKTKLVKKITPGLLQTIREMIKLTKTFMEPEGVGLAATQVGHSEQYFIAKLEDGTFKTFFNPKILSFSKRTKFFMEGCLSIPNYWGEITRPVSITASYIDEMGITHKEQIRGFLAWVFQHEYDHLQGRLFMDLLMEQHGKLYKVVGKDRAGSDIYEQVPL